MKSYNQRNVYSEYNKRNHQDIEIGHLKIDNKFKKKRETYSNNHSR